MLTQENVQEKKIIAITAPSGGGKTTLKKSVLQNTPDIEFAISCTNREKRIGEVNGVDYWFLSTEEILKKIANNEFAEYQEVYPGKFYGTLKSEIKRIMDSHHHVLLDVDVKGAVNIKKLYPNAKIIFVKPRSWQVLEKRLIERNQNSKKDLKNRIKKAPKELQLADKMCSKGMFNVSLLNDCLETSTKTINTLAAYYLKQRKAA